MTLRDKAATALDLTHGAAARKFGLYTDWNRDVLATWLDGEKIAVSLVRKSVAYLEMIARSHGLRATS